MERLNSAALAAHSITYCRGELVMYCIRVCNKKKIQKNRPQAASSDLVTRKAVRPMGPPPQRLPPRRSYPSEIFLTEVLKQRHPPLYGCVSSPCVYHSFSF